MKSALQKYPSGKWQSRVTLAILFVSLTAISAQAEAPHAQLRPFGPGGIAIDWEHPNDGAESITLEREAPAHTWVFTALVNSFNDLGLEPSRAYRYRLCAKYGSRFDCTTWLRAETLATPVPYSPPAVPSFTSASATSNSITVSWTSSGSYGFHQVRWAEDGHRDSQNQVTGRSFTANGLTTGSYHFIVQGCNRTLGGASCSSWSAPFRVRTLDPPPPPPPPLFPELPQIFSSQIFWHNASTGETQIWFMNGSSRFFRANLVEGSRPISVREPWRPVANSDYDGAGQTDLLWHNSSTGESQIWTLLGRTVDERKTVIGENGSAILVGLPWSIVGSNDMSENTDRANPGLVGDGAPDIIWHNASTGETQIWHMNRHRVIRRTTVLGENGSAAFVGLPWRIAGSRDFNEDKKTDLLWHNASTGETQIWHMDAYRVIGRATVLGENGSAIMVGLPWRIAGTHDFNLDGRSDILWHNGSTGETQMWLMNGRSIVRRVTVDANADGGAAHVVAPWSIVNH